MADPQRPVLAIRADHVVRRADQPVVDDARRAGARSSDRAQATSVVAAAPARRGRQVGDRRRAVARASASVGAISTWISSDSSSSARSRPLRRRPPRSPASFSRRRVGLAGVAVPAVGVAADRVAPGVVARLAEPDRRAGPLDRLRAADRRRGVEVAPSKVERRPRRARAHRSGQAPRPCGDPLVLVRPVQAVGADLGLLPAAVVEEDQPPALERVERRGHLGGECRRAERLGEVDRAELDLAGPAGDDRRGSSSLPGCRRRSRASGGRPPRPSRTRAARPRRPPRSPPDPAWSRPGCGRRPGRDWRTRDAEPELHQPFSPDIVTPWTK